MLVDTKSLILNADAKTVFNFLAKEENLPKWAIHYCQAIRKEGDDYIISTPHGEMFYAVDADPKTGVVDLKSGPTKNDMMAFPARVTPLPDGTSIFNLTCILMDDMSDEELEGLRQAFNEEFDTLKKAVA